MKNRVTAITALIFTGLLVSPSVWAWGRIGHRVAAQMAESRLTPHALAAVHDLLGPGESLAGISTWADEHRNPNSGAWHYVDVPITESRYDPKYCPPRGCVVSKIGEFRRVLMNPLADKLEKQEALKYLVHSIEDLHQPMHVADNNDRGGNLTQVQFLNRGSNLHSVWDSKIIEHASEDKQKWLGDINSLANARNIIEWSKGMPEDWATESLQAAKEAYYLPGTRTVMRSGARLGDDYCRTALPVIRSQLAKAGIRLAFLLNEIFRSSATTQPTEKTALNSAVGPESRGVASGQTSQIVYHGNVSSKIFHSPSCKNYNCKNCTREFKSREAAVAAGFKPCGMCNP